MKRCWPILLATPLLLANADPSDIPIPPAIRAMLDAAIASNNDSEIAVIVKYARAVDPASGDAVARIADSWRVKRREDQVRTIREASFVDLWTGRAQLGGWKTTGNSDNTGLSAVIDLNREGIRWRQKFKAQADYQESANVTTREHYLASYEPNYKIDDRAYIYGAAQYESDRFLGYYDRYSASVGAGYSAIKTPRVKLDLELGPAFRDTSFTDDTQQRSAAARGSLDFNWKLTNGLSISQTASAYVQRFNSTVNGLTALNAKLIGPLSAQLSYNVQFESTPPVGSVSTDTTTRASLVYSF
ncbi:DUF481 domain-containing protein [Sphingomonas sp. Leaf17]|uniref:DUF481 domain-containing protein n=1 Tax=Sphingomonas sp. Leaf17 TaxID=1735683 RepID=UPI000A539415|nr:DUF481 domain-containing protein [Sphingomonas sp. Leaf17]